jgi:DNA-binding transcriptional ArsR family regulator
MIDLDLTSYESIKEDAEMSPVTGSTSARVRADTMTQWLGELDATSADWEAPLAVVSSTLVDALVYGDAHTLREISDPVRDVLARLFEGRGHAHEARGYLLAVLAMARMGLERLPDPAAVQLAADTHAAKALSALSEGRPLSSQELRSKLGTSASQMSRVGRQLLASGLVVQRRAGRTASWEITPRGREAAELSTPHRRSSAR